VLARMLAHHPHRALAPLARVRLHRLLCRLHGPTLSNVRASGKPGAVHFPYLLRDLVIERPNQVVLAWRLSNTMDTAFCVNALDEALARFCKPDIFNADQGSQFTSAAFTGRLAGTGSASRWTVAVAGSITSSSSGCGGR
jgi:putative transposase